MLPGAICLPAIPLCMSIQGLGASLHEACSVPAELQMYGGLLLCGGFVFLDQGFARGQSQTPILALALVQVLVT